MATQRKRTPAESPSLYSYGSNRLSTEPVYRQRLKYDTIFKPDLIPNYIETWGTDAAYGKINTLGNAVSLDAAYVKPLRYTREGTSLYALAFVADAWRDFVERVQNEVSSDRMYRNSPWADMVAHRAWVGVDDKYNEYMRNQVYDSFRKIYVGEVPLRNKRILNLNSFLEVFSEYMSEVISDAGPLTRSGFIESSYTTPLISGLVIEIASDPYDDDLNKIQKYLDGNFIYVAHLAAQYGFLIDRNIPFRLVADLGSPAMKEYMKGVDIVGFEQNSINSLGECEKLLEKSPRPPIDAFGYSKIPGLESVRRHVNVFLGEHPNRRITPGYAALQSVVPIGSSQSHTSNQVFQAYYNETWVTDMEYVGAYLKAMYNALVTTAPIVSDRRLWEKCRMETRILKRLPSSPDAFDLVTGSFQERWSLRSFYALRTIERGVIKDDQQRMADLEEAFAISDAPRREGSPITTLEAYESALAHIQETIIGPFQ
jgi:hypothetical protein